jgi:hypothetical protein
MLSFTFEDPKIGTKEGCGLMKVPRSPNAQRFMIHGIRHWTKEEKGIEEIQRIQFIGNVYALIISIPFKLNHYYWLLTPRPLLSPRIKPSTYPTYLPQPPLIMRLINI